MMRRIFLSILVLFSCNAAELIVNGSFETGDFTGWTTANQLGSSGQWYVYSTTLPFNYPLLLSGNSFFQQPDGTYGAVTDQGGSSSNILYQDITIPLNSIAILQFSYAYENYYSRSPPISPAFFATPNTLDSSMYPTIPNQQFRVDIMSPTSGPFSVAVADVLRNLVQVQVGDPNTLPYTIVSFDLTEFAGQTIRLRFAAVSNLGYLNLGIDGVSLIATPLPTPSAPNPPSNLRTCAKCNRFLSQSEQFVILNWDASPSASVVAYRVYKNGVLIATVQDLCYQDHNVCGNNVYQVAAIDKEGHESKRI